MQLKVLPLNSVHFPKNEWSWLRSPISMEDSFFNENDFFFGTTLSTEDSQKYWVWHNSGREVITSSPSDEKKIHVLILKENCSELDAYSLYLHTTFKQSPKEVQDIEWINALSVLAKRFNYDLAATGLPKLWDQTLSAVNLAPHLGALAPKLKFTFLDFDEKKFLFEKKWDAATFELLETLSQIVRKVFFEKVKSWSQSGLSASQAKEALHFTVMLARKNSEKTVLQILNNEFKNAEEFRSTLMNTAQPEFANLSHQRILSLRSLKVPARTSVYGDPNFEKELLKITHSPRSVHDFEIFKSWVNEPETLEKIRTLLEIYQ